MVSFDLAFSEQELTELTGIPQSRMVKEFRGELVYNQEVQSPIRPFF
jgi:hypothetical protein